jgi:uncharacterized membrane protein YjdF
MEKMSLMQQYLVILALAVIGSTIQITHTISPVDDRTWMYGVIGIVSAVMFFLTLINGQGISKALTYFILNIFVCGAAIIVGFFIGSFLTGAF